MCAVWFWLQLFLSCCLSRFYYKDFRDLSWVTLVGSATPIAPGHGCLNLTSSAEQTGALWYNRQVHLDSETEFSTMFHFQIKPGRRRGAELGDGLAFVLHAADAGTQGLGTGGGPLGQGTLGHGLAVEFDTRALPDSAHDPQTGAVLVHFAAPGLHLSSSVSEAPRPFKRRDVRTGARVTVQIKYSHVLGDNPGEPQTPGKLGLVRVYVNDPVTPLLQFQTAVLTGDFVLGFTAANGAHSYDKHQICDWHFDRLPSRIASGSDDVNGGVAPVRFASTPEPCDLGFEGPECGMDLRLLEDDCMAMARSGCGACTAHPARHCAWCGTSRRCLPAALFQSGGFADDGAHPHKHPKRRGGAAAYHSCYRADSLRFHPDTCDDWSGVPLVWLWSSLLIVLVLALCAGTMGLVCFVRHSTHALVHDACALTFHTVLGSLFACVVAFAVNATLIEVSISPFYAFCFGLMFIFIGLLLLWQSISFHFGNANATFEGSLGNCFILFAFAIEIVASGVLCFLLEKDWSTNLSVRAKVPLYACLGVAICFATVFALVDVSRACALLLRSCCRDSDMGGVCGWKICGGSPLIQSVVQVRLLAATAVICGFYFGWIFGVLDVEDVASTHMEMTLQRDDAYCYPIAAAVGGLAAFCNQYLHLHMPQNIELQKIDYYMSDTSDGL